MNIEGDVRRELQEACHAVELHPGAELALRESGARTKRAGTTMARCIKGRRASAFAERIIDDEIGDNGRLIAAAPIGLELANEIMKYANACPRMIVEMAGEFLQMAEVQP